VEGNRKIWGTTFTQAEMQAMVRRFLVTFHAQAGEQPAGEPQQADDAMATYVALLRQVCLREGPARGALGLDTTWGCTPLPWDIVLAMQPQRPCLIALSTTRHWCPLAAGDVSCCTSVA